VSSVSGAGPGSSSSSSSSSTSSVCSGGFHGSSSSCCGRRHLQLPAAHLLQGWQEAAAGLQQRQSSVPQSHAQHMLQQWEGRQQRPQRAVCGRALVRVPALNAHMVQHRACVRAAPLRLL
jgi:hypothetical protein